MIYTGLAAEKRTPGNKLEPFVWRCVIYKGCFIRWLCIYEQDKWQIKQMGKINLWVINILKGDILMRCIWIRTLKCIFFLDICNVPHPSYKERKSTSILLIPSWGKKTWTSNQEFHNNVCNHNKESLKGYEDAAPSVLRDIPGYGMRDTIVIRIWMRWTESWINMVVLPSAKGDNSLVVMME